MDERRWETIRTPQCTSSDLKSEFFRIFKERISFLSRKYKIDLFTPSPYYYASSCSPLDALDGSRSPRRICLSWTHSKFRMRDHTRCCPWSCLYSRDDVVSHRTPPRWSIRAFKTKILEIISLGIYDRTYFLYHDDDRTRTHPSMDDPTLESRGPYDSWFCWYRTYHTDDWTHTLFYESQSCISSESLNRGKIDEILAKLSRMV